MKKIVITFSVFIWKSATYLIQRSTAKTASVHIFLSQYFFIYQQFNMECRTEYKNIKNLKNPYIFCYSNLLPE